MSGELLEEDFAINWDELEEIWTNEELNSKQKYKQTANELSHAYSFKTPYSTERLYLYEPTKGVYTRYGKEKVQKLLEEQLGGFLSQHDKNEIISKIKQLTYWKRPFSPENPWLVPLENGVYDMKKEKLLQHSPDYFFTSRLPYPYNPEAEPKKNLQFIYEVVDIDFIPVVQEVFGYCLYRGYPFRKLFLFLGPEGVGKSVLLKVLFHFLGGEENVSGEEIQKLVNTRFAQYQLYQKLANIYADVPTKPLRKNAYLKMLTGGDLISAEIKRVQDRVKFYNYAKLIFSGNEPPKLKRVEEAVVHRFLPIKCRREWEEKKPRQELIGELTTKEELSGLFNWALKGLKRIMRRRGFYETEKIRDFKEEWLIQANPLHVFLKKVVEKDPRKYMPKNYFYENLALWCEEHGVSPPSKNYVGKNLPGILPGVKGKKRTHGGRQKRCWVGIDWKGSPPSGEDEVKIRRELRDLSTKKEGG